MGGHRRQEMPHQEEEEVRVGPPPGDDQARPPEDPHPQDQGWQQEVQGAQARHWQLCLGLRGHCPQPGSSTLSTTLATMSWSGPRPSSRTPSSSSMLPPSVSGMISTTLNLSPERMELS